MSRDAVDRMEILLVEDNLADANVTIQALKSGNVRCRVTLVCDGEEAISFLYRKGEFARVPKPDLILLDMQLPKKEGQLGAIQFCIASFPRFLGVHDRC